MLLKLVSYPSLEHSKAVDKKESLPIRIPETLVKVSTRISCLPCEIECWKVDLPSSNNGASKSVGLLRLRSSHDCYALVVKIEDFVKTPVVWRSYRFQDCRIIGVAARYM